MKEELTKILKKIFLFLLRSGISSPENQIPATETDRKDFNQVNISGL